MEKQHAGILAGLVGFLLKIGVQPLQYYMVFHSNPSLIVAAFLILSMSSSRKVGKDGAGGWK